MELGLRGKAAIVTGGSRGIGKAVARTLLSEGCAVTICARNGERLEGAVQDLTKVGPRVLGIPTDGTDERAVHALVDRALVVFDRIDILVNNAGTHLRGTVESTTIAILEQQLRDKVFGFFAMIQELPIMKHQRDGRIVNIVGQAGRHPHPDRFPSGVTNAAVMAMTKSVADAVARDTHNISRLSCSPFSSPRRCVSGASIARPLPEASRVPIRWDGQERRKR